jgi:hypothetical protein
MVTITETVIVTIIESLDHFTLNSCFILVFSRWWDKGNDFFVSTNARRNEKGGDIEVPAFYAE